MRAKKAKRLHKHAHSLTVGMPEVSHIVIKVYDGKGQAYTDRGQVVLGNCTRAVYQKLKKAVR